MRRRFYLVVLALVGSHVVLAQAVALEAKLKALGHEVRVMEHTSGLQTIMRTRAGWVGGADPRREGTAAGD